MIFALFSHLLQKIDPQNPNINNKTTLTQSFRLCSVIGQTGTFVYRKNGL